jgi:hypothetical protein
VFGLKDWDAKSAHYTVSHSKGKLAIRRLVQLDASSERLQSGMQGFDAATGQASELEPGGLRWEAGPTAPTRSARLHRLPIQSRADAAKSVWRRMGR